jgi:hypothetical protein
LSSAQIEHSTLVIVCGQTLHYILDSATGWSEAAFVFGSSNRLLPGLEMSCKLSFLTNSYILPQFLLLM